MNALEEARTVIERLDVHDRQALINWMSSESVEVAPGIYRTPGVCGGEACIRSMRFPVWLLEEGRRNGANEEQLLKAHPNLTPSDLANAWAYVRTHRLEIDNAIHENTDV